MKRILFTLAAFSALCTGLAAQQRADTLVVNRPDKVTVITSRDNQEIRIQGSEADPDYNYKSVIGISPSGNIDITVRDGGLDLFNFDIFKSKKKNETAPKRKRSHFSTNELERIDVGFTDALSRPQDVDLSPRFFSDLGISFLNIRFRPFYEVLEFSTGLELGYRALAVGGGKQFVLQDGIVDIVPMVEKYRRQKSSLRYNYVGMPLYVSFLLGSRDNRLSFGVAGHYNFQGRIRDRYVDASGAKISYKTENILLEKLSWEYCLRLDLDEIGAYVKYSPCSVLASGKGPSFNTLSFGLSLIF